MTLTEGVGASVKLPNFLIVGAPRSGTTSLYNCLRQHPEVFMPRLKEPRFFVSSVRRIDRDGDHYSRAAKQWFFCISTFEDYIKLFKDAREEKAIGEASPQYLYRCEVAIPGIRKYLGDVKIIVILRNPIERAWSAYNLLFRSQTQILPFERYLEIEEERGRENLHRMYGFKEKGFYYRGVKAYMEAFSEVKVYLFDDLKSDTLGLVQDVFKFLDVDSCFVPQYVNTSYNPSGIPRNNLFHKLMVRENAFRSMARLMSNLILPEGGKRKLVEGIFAKNLVKPEMKPETRERLKNVFKDDILRLQTFINRDLSHWLK